MKEGGGAKAFSCTFHVMIYAMIKEDGDGPNVQVHDDTRAWDRPSDHAPVSVDLRFDL